MGTSCAINSVEEQRYQIRKAFENGEPLQYRARSSQDTYWATAHWCGWDWSSYEYRIKPKEKEKVEVLVPMYPYLIDGVVVWCTEECAALKQNAYPAVSLVPITKFRTVKGVRNVVIEEEVS